MEFFRPPDIEKMEAGLDIKGLIRLLKNRDESIRRKAAGALVRIGDPGGLAEVDRLVFTPLLQALGSSNHVERMAAATGLATVGHRKAIPLLIDHLAEADDNQWGVVERVVYALSKIPDERAIKPLVSLMMRLNLTPKNRQEIAAALEACGWKPEAETEKIWYSIATQNWDECVKIGKPAVLPLLNTVYMYHLCMDGKGSRLVDNCLAEIHKNDPTCLEECLLVQNSGTRWWAANALDQFGWKPGKDEIGTAYWITREKWDECIKIGTPAVPMLRKLLGNPDAKLRCSAYNALEKMDWQPGEEDDTDSRVIFWRATLEFGGWKARNTAVEKLNLLGWTPTEDEVGATYWIAVRDWDACEKLGGAAIKPLIKYGLDDGHWDVRKSAAQVLIRLYRFGNLNVDLEILIGDNQGKITSEHSDGHTDENCIIHVDGFIDNGIGLDFKL